MAYSYAYSIEQGQPATLNAVNEIKNVINQERARRGIAAFSWSYPYDTFKKDIFYELDAAMSGISNYSTNWANLNYQTHIS